MKLVTTSFVEHKSAGSRDALSGDAGNSLMVPGASTSCNGSCCSSCCSW